MNGSAEVWRVQLLPYEREVCLCNGQKKRERCKRRKRSKMGNICKVMPSHLYDLFTSFLAYMEEVLKLVDCETETQVYEKLIELFKVLTVLGYDVLQFLKFYYTSLLRALSK